MTWQERKTPDDDAVFMASYLEHECSAQWMARTYGVDHQSIRRRLRRIEKDQTLVTLTELLRGAMIEAGWDECRAQMYEVKEVPKR